MREAKIEELKAAIIEVRSEIEEREFDIRENATQDMLANVGLGCLILASFLGGGIYTSKRYLLDKLRRNNERLEQRRTLPLGHYTAA